MKNTKTWQRVLSMAVCLCMIVGLVPAIASPASAAAAAATLTIEGVTDYTKLAPYGEYPLVLTTAGGTAYTADQGVTLTLKQGQLTPTAYNYPEGSTTFAGTVSDSNVGYISKRGYFIATGFGQATLTVTASVDGEEVATGTLDVTVAQGVKSIYKFDFRKAGGKLPLNAYNSSANRTWTSYWSLYSSYNRSTQGDDAEDNPYAFMSAGYNGTGEDSLDTDPWVYSSQDTTYSNNSPTTVSINNYGTMFKGKWITFKVKIPEDGIYSIQHLASSGTQYNYATLTDSQSIYLAPVNDIAGDVTTTDAKYFLFTEDRSVNGDGESANDWQLPLPVTPIKKTLKAGEYYVTFTMPDPGTQSIVMAVGEMRFTRVHTLDTVELNYGTNALKYAQSYTPTVTGLMTDSSAANLTNATYKYSVISGTAVSVNETTGALTTNSTGNATIKVDVTLDGVTVSDTVNVTVTEDLEYKQTFNFAVSTNATENGADAHDAYYEENGVKMWAYNYELSSGLQAASRVRRFNGGGISANISGEGDWFVIRLNVQRAGWYLPTFTYHKGVNYASVARFYVAPASVALPEGGYTSLDKDARAAALENVYNTYAQTKYSIGSLNMSASTSSTPTENLKPVYIAQPGEYALLCEGEKRCSYGTGGYGGIYLKTFTLDRLAFTGNTNESTVISSIDLASVIPQAERSLSVGAEEAKTFTFAPTAKLTDNTTTYADDLVSANVTITSSDTDILKVTTEPLFPTGYVTTKSQKLTLTPVAAGEANVTITATRDGVTYTEVIPIKVTHDVANFGTHYAYIRETKDGEKTVYNLALIAGIDDVQATEYAAVGFQYQLGDGDLITPASKTSVYSQLTAGTNNASITAAELGATYLFFDEYEFEKGYADTPVKFRAYATLKDGTTVYGGWFTIDSVAKAAVASN